MEKPWEKPWNLMLRCGNAGNGPRSTEPFQGVHRTVPGCPWDRSELSMEFPGFPLKCTGISMESVRLSQSIPGKLSEYSGDFR